MSEDKEKLQYGMLGEDAMSDDEKIAKYTGDVDWSYLKPHFKAGNLIYVDPELDLKVVAQAFTNDDKEQVQAWLKQADLVKPDHLHAEWWEHDQPEFIAVIVNPFVLAQPKPLEG